jgi:RHS repeat-associated protein
MRLSRLLTLFAALVLTCASVTAQAHVGPFGSAAETARRDFLPDLATASRVIERVTASRVWENYDCASNSASGSCVDAFGVEIGREGSTDVEHLYRGERWDAKVAAYDLRARLYMPGNGRFLTQDSFVGFSMDPQSLHKYGFNHNDPINRVDPSGHMSAIEFGTGVAVAAILGAATITAIDNWRKRPGASPQTQPAVWDAIALPMFRAKANAEVDAAAVATTRVRKKDREEGHHTIPVYLCGGMGQDTSAIPQSKHQQIHAGLTSVYVIKKFSEDYATKVLFGGRRSEDIVLDIALTPQGRGAIANAIDSFYYYGGWDSYGTPSIRQVFNKERPLYVSGERTSLPWCSRTGQP